MSVTENILQEESKLISKEIGRKFSQEDVAILIKMTSLLSGLREKYNLGTIDDVAGILSILENVLISDNMDKLAMFVGNFDDIVNEM